MADARIVRTGLPFLGNPSDSDAVQPTFSKRHDLKPSAQLRQIRAQLGLSQRKFSARLGVSFESYRTWESGRRGIAGGVLSRAAELARVDQPGLPMPLASLAKVLGVCEMTLRNAVRSGRLPIVANAPAGLGKPILRAMRADGEAFLAEHYRRAPHWNSHRRCLTGVPRVPADCATRVRQFRTGRHLSQRDLAHQLGAAGRAVVYQWECGRRRPSPILWLRLLAMGA